MISVAVVGRCGVSQSSTRHLTLPILYAPQKSFSRICQVAPVWTPPRPIRGMCGGGRSVWSRKSVWSRSSTRQSTLPVVRAHLDAPRRAVEHLRFLESRAVHHGVGNLVSAGALGWVRFAGACWLQSLAAHSAPRVCHLRSYFKQTPFSCRYICRDIPTEM